MRLKTPQLCDIQYFFSERTSPRWIHPFSTEISGRSQTATWKLRLQYSCKHRVSLWLNTGYTLGADIRHFTEFQERFCLFTLPYLFRSWVRTMEMELFTHFIDLHQHSLKNRSKLSNLHRTNRAELFKFSEILQKKKKISFLGKLSYGKNIYYSALHCNKYST